MGQIDRATQRHGERLGLPGRVRRQEALIPIFRYDGERGRRPRAAADQNDQERAAGRGGLYDSATTNGLPPTLPLISGTAASASALVA